MAQELEEQRLRGDPLHDVKEEIENSGRRLRHVDLHKRAPQDVQMDQYVKGDVPEPFSEELKNDHYITEGVHDVNEDESEFKEQDPLHDVKQEIERGTPHLRHVETHTPGKDPRGGAIVKGEVPSAFQDELRHDHNIVEKNEEVLKSGEDSPGAEVDKDGATVEAFPRATFAGVPGRGKPSFRISAHHGMRPGGPLSRDLKAESAERKNGEEEGEPLNALESQEAVFEDRNEQDGGLALSSSGNKEESRSDGSITVGLRSGAVGGRGKPTFRISAHHGMRPGGPLSRDLKSETAASNDGDDDACSHPEEHGTREGGILNDESQEGVFGEIGKKWDELNSYEKVPISIVSADKSEEDSAVAGMETISDRRDGAAARGQFSESGGQNDGFLQKIKGGIKDQLLPTKSSEK